MTLTSRFQSIAYPLQSTSSALAPKTNAILGFHFKNKQTQHQENKMDEHDTKTVIVPLPKEALEWLERALQWPEDLPAFDRLNKPINGSELGIPL